MNLLDEILTELNTKTRSEIFGLEDRKKYRKLLTLTHPDRWPGETVKAEKVFQLINKLWIEDPTKVFTTSKRTYTLLPEIYHSDIADIQKCTWEEKGTEHGMLKIPRAPSSNDLLDREVKHLKHLAAGDAKWQPYIPTIAESFRHQSPDKTIRKAIIFKVPKNMVTLKEIMDKRPDGLDPRDAAWMWRRLLVALGYSHQCKIVHGAVLPENIGIVPEEHGVILLNWHLSTETNTKILAMPAKETHLYPPEVPSGSPAGPGTDIYLLSQTMKQAIGGKLPRPLAAFIQGCTLPSITSRPQDAWGLLEELDELLERMYGPRKFRPFTL